jgi:hypothetical protein
MRNRNRTRRTPTGHCDTYWGESCRLTKNRVREFVLAPPEMEKRRPPLGKIPPLRGGDFRGVGVYRPITVCV